MERRKICRYFERGSCKKENCPFVHLRENRKNCVFYMEGRCNKGNNCNFYHPPKEEEKLATLKEELKNKVKAEKKANEEQHSSESEHEEPQKKQHQHETHSEHSEELHEQKHEHIQKEIEPVEEEEFEQLAIPIPKIQQSQDQLQKQKIAKINFLLGVNDDYESSSEEQEKQQPKQEKSIIQFNKIYPKKFVDMNKTPQMKEQIKKNQAQFFKGEKFLDIINRLEDPIEKQYFQIIRKYTDHFVPIEGEFLHFTIKMRPLLFQKEINLHFDFKQQTLDLQVNGSKYPKERAIFTILNPSIPADYKQKFQKILSNYHSTHSIVDSLKFFQNHFQKIYHQSHSKLQNEFYSKKQLDKKIEKHLNSKTEVNIIQQPKKKKKRDRPAKNSNPYVKQIKLDQREKIDVLQYSYEVTVDSLHLQNCEYVMLQRMLVYLQCTCEQKISYIFDTTNNRALKVNVKLQCVKCRNIIIFGLEREVVQVRHETLGRIGVSSGHLLEIGGIGFKVGCICNNEISNGKIYLPGERISTNCHNCFQSIQINYMGLKYYNPTLKIPQVHPNHELPGKGVCKHMKLTFRWYRYGCCGRCFSCDDCHIIGSVSVHQKVKGITMLCGYCSHQQPIADICAFCHKQLVKGVEKTGHWQGGYGCRDQTNLSRKDNKKYTGLTKKKQKEK